MCHESGKSLFLYKGKSGGKTVIAGQIGRAAFKPIGEIRGQIFAVRGAACAAGNERIQPLGQRIRQQQSAYAAGTQQALVPGDT